MSPRISTRITSPRSIALAVGAQLVMPLRTPEPTWIFRPSQPPSIILVEMIWPTAFSVMPGLISRSTSPATRSVRLPTLRSSATSSSVLSMRTRK